MLSYAAKTDIGCHRDNNEDHYVACPELNLWVLADGVGGQDGGEVASEITCRVIQEELGAGASLEDAIHQAHDRVLDAPLEGVGRPGMASTVVGLLVRGDSYQVSWVGDSRCYLWSTERGLEQVSRDHSLIQQLLEEQHINEEEAAVHPGRNIVLQALGQEKLEYLHVDTIKDRFEDGQIVLMCSDGLSDYVSHADIADILRDNDDLQQVADRLIARTLSNSGADNVTVILVRLERQAVNETRDNRAVNLRAVIKCPLVGLPRGVVIAGVIIAVAALVFWF